MDRKMKRRRSGWIGRRRDEDQVGYEDKEERIKLDRKMKRS